MYSRHDLSAHGAQRHYDSFHFSDGQVRMPNDNTRTYSISGRPVCGFVETWRVVMSSKVWLSVICSAPPLIAVSRRLACSSLRASFAASCDENETVVCIFRDIAPRLIGPIDSMICLPLLWMRSRKKASTSPVCVNGGKSVTRKVCCFESMV